MSYIKYILFLFLAVNGIEKYQAQNNEQSLQLNRIEDSLQLSLKKARHDTARLMIYVNNAVLIHDYASQKAMEWYNIVLKLSDEYIKKYPKSSREHYSCKKSQADALGYIGYIYHCDGNFAKAMEYYRKAIKIQEEIGDDEGLASILGSLGYIYKDQGDITKALEYMNRALKIEIKRGYKASMAVNLSNIGIAYLSKGDIVKALEYYSKSLKLMEEMGNKEGIATAYNNIGFVYDGQGDYAKAFEYYNNSLKIREEIGDKYGLTYSYTNLGYLFDLCGDLSVTSSKAESMKAGDRKALEYYEKTLAIQEELGDQYGLARTLNNIAQVYLRQNLLDKCFEYHSKALKLREKIGDKPGVANSLNGLSAYYLEKKNFSKAIEFAKRSLQLSKEVGFPVLIMESSESLYHISKTAGDYKTAMESYETYIQMRDSMSNDKNRKASIKNQLKYEYEKQAAADSVAHAKESEIKNAEIAKQTAEIKAKKNQQYALFGGLGLVIIFAAFMFNRFKVTQKQKAIIESQKEIVEEQKMLVEEKQKEILDSIYYARRIQMALMPSEKRVAGTIRRLKK